MPGREFWRGVFQFQTAKVTPWLGLRNAVGVVIPLVAFAALGDLPAGLIAGVGALDVSFSDSHGPFPQRRRRMLAAASLVSLAVSAGAIAGHDNFAAILLATIGGFIAGLLVAVSTDAADLGVISLVTMVVFAATPLPLDKAFYAGLLALAGGLFQTGLALAPWPLRRFLPERRALADLYLELSELAISQTEVREAPPASLASTEAQSSLASLDRDRSVEAERYRLLLHHAERLRMTVLLLIRLRNRIRRETPSSDVAFLNEYLSLISHSLAAIGTTLRASGASTQLLTANEDVQKASERLAALSPSGDAFGGSAEGTLIADALSETTAVFKRLRTVMDLAQSCTSLGLEAFERREALVPWQLRLAGTYATLRSSLSLDSAIFRHAVRLAVCVGLGEFLSRSLELQRAYWMPMTIVLVLKPDFASTFGRGVLRLLGTFAGLGIATLLFHFVPKTAVPAQVLSVAVFIFILRCWGSANYGIFTAAITSIVVILNELGGGVPIDVAGPRVLNTAAGGTIALLAYALWPTWERTQVPSAFAIMLDTYRNYLRGVREANQAGDKSGTRQVDSLRLAARRARLNLEASVDRLAIEPGTSDQSRHLLGVALASSHRLAHAALAVEAILATRSTKTGQEFTAFAIRTELVLYYLAQTLRGSIFDRACLTDLNDSEALFVAVGRSAGEHLLVTEADRIASSLNTLTDELLAWIALSSTR